MDKAHGRTGAQKVTQGGSAIGQARSLAQLNFWRNDVRDLARIESADRQLT